MDMKQENLTPSIEIDPPTTTQRTIIWLHGLGADGGDFAPIVPELHLPDSLGIRYVFPHAPIMPVTINNGYKMRAWFDIYGIAIASKIDAAGIATSVSLLEDLIAHEVARGIDTKNIILAGFSQGAVIALTTGLCYAKKLGGIMALSGYLPLADQVLQKASAANRDTPIFLAHGTEDPIVAYAFGKAIYDNLKEAGYPVTWHSYPMPHTVCGQEVKDISEWIKNSFLNKDI